jgi:glycosyl transferase family 25
VDTNLDLLNEHTLPFRQHVITISEERLREFIALNQHLTAVEVHRGVKGEDLIPEDLIAEGIFDAEALGSGLLTPGTIGNSHSLFILLKECAAGADPFLVMEDDVLTHPMLHPFLIENWRRIEFLDFIALGYNTDSSTSWESSGGMAWAALNQPNYPTAEWIQNYFFHTDPRDSRLSRLISMFGTCCFIVTPKGAEGILSSVFPLSLKGCAIPFLQHLVAGISVDRKLNQHYRELNAYICIPPLALSPNTESMTKPGAQR